MVRWTRDPLLACGVVLFMLGVGNWVLGHSKVREYTERARGSNSERPERLSDFPELTPRTNATLLEQLDKGYSHAAAKLDFYAVVEHGGRTVMLFGVLLVAAAVVRAWWHHYGRASESRVATVARPPR